MSNNNKNTLDIFNNINNKEINLNDIDIHDINNINNNNLYKSKDSIEENELNEEDNNNLNDSLEEKEENNYIKFNDINLDDENLDELLKTIITNKRKSIAERSSTKTKKMTSNYKNNNNTISNSINCLKNNIFININNSNNSCSSTQNQTSQKKIYIKNKEKNINDKNNKNKNKNISEFNYNSLKKSNISNKNINININSFDSNNKDKDIITKINNNRIIFKQWLSSIDLSFYYVNFIENEIYEVHQLINISKKIEPDELFRYISCILKTKKYGHIYRIICQLEIDTYIIDSKIKKFLSPNISQEVKNNKSEKDNLLSISGGRNVLCGRNNINKEEKENEKETLKIFLNKYGMIKLYHNFCHNGFDIIEYVILQMYSKMPITDYILENHFHIYEKNDRNAILEALINEKQRIDIFINSEDYFLNKRYYKYENFISENKNNNRQLVIKDDGKRCNLCSIF